jgi:hypothetical protein
MKMPAGAEPANRKHDGAIRGGLPRLPEEGMKALRRAVISRASLLEGTFNLGGRYVIRRYYQPPPSTCGSERRR